MNLTRLNKPKIELLDIILLIFLSLFGFLIVFPFYNVIVVSFTSQQEFMTRPLILFPNEPTLEAYRVLFRSGEILIGYRTTLLFLAVGLPVNLFLTTSLAYGLSRSHLPGKKVIISLVIFTMLFNGGMIPLYLVMLSLGLTNTIWSVVFAYGVNTFYFIIMRSYFLTLPDSLVESARLDGAGEWRILWSIILPLSKPIIATMTLFYAVDRWNEWFNAMIFIRRGDMTPLQLVLRSIIIDSQVLANITAAGGAHIMDRSFSTGLQMAAVIVTMLPVMCVFPFLQKYFVKGVMIGAIKA